MATQFNETVEISRYFLPEEGVAAHTRLIAMMSGGAGEWYMLCFTLNDPALLDAIDALDAAGVRGHIAADHTQETTPGEHALLLARAAKWQNTEIVILTAGCGPKPSQIWHYKVVARQSAEGPATIMEGSCNLSPVTTGWAEGNLVNFYNSDTMFAAVADEYERHRSLALAHEAQYQISNFSCPSVVATVIDAAAAAA